MPSYKEHFGSLLKVEDIQGKQVRVVIERVASEEVGSGDGPKDKKLVAHFVGKDKGLVLNKTNADTLHEMTGTDQFDQWSGTPVILFADPNVMYGGKKVGGIRMRAVALKNAPPAPAPLPIIQQREPGEDDVPDEDDEAIF